MRISSARSWSPPLPSPTRRRHERCLPVEASGNSIAPTIPEFLSRVPRRPVAVISTPTTSERRRPTMTKPTSTEKVVPITVGNPNPTSIASFIIDQSHMEDYTKAEEEKSSMVKVERARGRNAALELVHGADRGGQKCRYRTF